VGEENPDSDRPGGLPRLPDSGSYSALTVVGPRYVDAKKRAKEAKEKNTPPTGPKEESEQQGVVSMMEEQFKKFMVAVGKQSKTHKTDSDSLLNADLEFVFFGRDTLSYVHTNRSRFRIETLYQFWAFGPHEPRFVFDRARATAFCARVIRFGQGFCLTTT
jgi:hypothetical protein